MIPLNYKPLLKLVTEKQTHFLTALQQYFIQVAGVYELNLDVELTQDHWITMDLWN